MQAFSSWSAHASLFPARGLSCPACEILVFLTRDQTRVPCNERQILNHWITSEVSQIVNNNYHSLSPYSNWHCAKHYDYIKSYGFSSSHVWMWELDHKEGWEPKNWCFQTVVLEKTLKSPLDCKGIKPINPKGNLSWIFIGRADAEAEAPILWPPDTKSQLTGKDLDAGKDWGQEEKRVTEDEMVGWHHWNNRHEFEQPLRNTKVQGSLVCCSPWGRKESDVT